MRFLFALVLLLSLPVMVIAHRQHYFMSLHAPLRTQAEKALQAPEFAKVKPLLNYLDVTLYGKVADLASRERARQLVDDVPGLRCREQDNMVQVTARLDGMLSDKKLALTGWLHDDAALRDACRWLVAARPGIEIVTSGVQVSPHVTIEDALVAGKVPAPFHGAWTAIEVPASLKIVRKEGRVVVTGTLPASLPKAAIVDAVAPGAGSGGVDATGLESGAFVRDAKFANAECLPAFLKGFFSSPGESSFEADASKVRVSANTTPTVEEEWLALLEPIAAGEELDARFRLFPSPLHFPERQRESQIEPESLAALQEVLRAAIINFSPGYVTADATEQTKITAAGAAIAGAGPEVRVIVGGHMDLSGNPKDNAIMARRRAEGVVAELVSRGVPSKVLEAAVFEAVPGGDDHSRQVELLVK